jgi:hypothetical protein
VNVVIPEQQQPYSNNNNGTNNNSNMMMMMPAEVRKERAASIDEWQDLVNTNKVSTDQKKMFN